MLEPLCMCITTWYFWSKENMLLLAFSNLLHAIKSKLPQLFLPLFTSVRMAVAGKKWSAWNVTLHHITSCTNWSQGIPLSNVSQRIVRFGAVSFSSTVLIDVVLVVLASFASAGVVAAAADPTGPSSKWWTKLPHHVQQQHIVVQWCIALHIQAPRLLGSWDNHKFQPTPPYQNQLLSLSFCPPHKIVGSNVKFEAIVRLTCCFDFLLPNPLVIIFLFVC